MICTSYEEILLSIHNNYIMCQCQCCKNYYKITRKLAKKIIKQKQTLYCRKCKISITKSNKTIEEKNAIKEKRKQTNLKKYGVETPLILNSTREKLKEVNWQERNKKTYETNLKKYGVKFITQEINVKEKIKKTMSERYGSHSSCDENVKNKKAQTNLKKYGCACPLQNPEIKNKTKKTNLKKYGVENPVQNEEIKKKIKETNLKKYGFENPMQNNNQIDKMIHSRNKDNFKKHCYLYKDICFDSSWELIFYIWLTDHNINFTYHPNIRLSYFINGQEKLYFPDFIVDEQLIEIKGNQFFNKNNEPYNYYNKTFWWEKYNFLIKNNIKILKQKDLKPYINYVFQKYGKLFIKSLKK